MRIKSEAEFRNAPGGEILGRSCSSPRTTSSRGAGEDHYLWGRHGEGAAGRLTGSAFNWRASSTGGKTLTSILWRGGTWAFRKR